METMKNVASVHELAEALEVSKSGFHAHQKKPQRPCRQRDRTLRALICASFEKSRQTYGCPRIRRDLQEAAVRSGPSSEFVSSKIASKRST